jgi:hypothetical protein
MKSAPDRWPAVPRREPVMHWKRLACQLVVGSVVAMCLPVHAVARAQPIDVSNWIGEDYLVTADPPANWIVAPDGLSVLQTTNANPAVFYGDLTVLDKCIEATVTVELAQEDDDFIGFVLGFEPGDALNPSADYLLIDWKRGDQTFDFGCGPVFAARGLAVSRVAGVPTGGEFWGHVNLDAPCSDLDNGIEELERASTFGDTGWVFWGETYVFRFELTAHSLRVYVDGALEIDVEGEFSDGRFAFYNFSQREVVYSVSESPLPSQKVDICHRTGNGSYRRINVSVNAVPAHMAHGDVFPTTLFADADGDGLGDPGVVVPDACPTPGFVDNDDDCADQDPTKHQNTEILISYFYSFIHDAPLTALVRPGEILTIYDEVGGCGPIHRDVAECEVSCDGRIRARNHDCLSGDGPGTFGPWVTAGCSTAEEFGYVVECCILDDTDGSCPADTNHDGAVDKDDLLGVIADWGTDGSGHDADIDRSRVVDADDISQ